jgi:hypothetical protein
MRTKTNPATEMASSKYQGRIERRDWSRSVPLDGFLDETRVAGQCSNAHPHKGVSDAHAPRREGGQRQASAGARDGVKGNGTISLRALRCMR